MEKRRRGKRLPVVLLMLLAAAEMLTLGGPAGAVPSSPLEILGAAAARAGAFFPQPEPEEGLPSAVLRAESTVTAENAPLRGTPLPEEAAEPPAAEGSLPEEKEAAEPKAAGEAQPESDPVEDSYFEDVVFLGDSRTEGFYLYSGLKTGKYLYAVGATVDSGHGKIPLLDALAELEAGKIYLMLGINELGWSRAENYRDQYAKLIDRVRADHPDAVIVLQSILPVSAKQDAKGSYVNNEKILAYNEIIAALAAEKDCVFLDSAQAVAGEDGRLPQEWTFDGVHLNPAGCRALLDYYRTHSVQERK